ncbi:CBO0543 family protein [Metabacillus herbersteinensis]|uniref:CBO0543 family protein n=1 Tax=Metabacillus herbersteinensis TaxID=283816 RepID=A0ABV6GJF0_9BACI
MRNQLEKTILRFLLVFGIVTFFNLIRKPPVKDWLIIFLIKGYISSILDKLLVRKGYIDYPVKLFKSFDISFIFDYLLFPVTCVYFNQFTKASTLPGIIAKLFAFSIPMAIIEHILEKKTKLISFKKGWNTYRSFITVNITFILVRILIGVIRKADNTPVPENR